MIKEFIEYYRQRKQHERERNRLLTSVWTVQDFQDLIRQVNKNPNLSAKLAYPDGRYIELANLAPDLNKHNKGDLYMRFSVNEE